MNKIFEHVLENVDHQIIDINFPARILSVIEKNNDIVLYSMGDDGKDVTTISLDILIIGTGEVVDDMVKFIFLGTVKLFDKEIWHVLYRYINRDQYSD